MQASNNSNSWSDSSNCSKQYKQSKQAAAASKQPQVATSKQQQQQAVTSKQAAATSENVPLQPPIFFHQQLSSITKGTQPQAHANKIFRSNFFFS